jgi:formamidopyrimidine-DNA glycosylase
MPELPEVQTVVTQLGGKLSGKTLLGFWTDWERKVLPSARVLAQGIRGAEVMGTRRFGKHIVIDLHHGSSLVIHLKMTGHLLYKTPLNRLSRAFTEDRFNGYIHHIFTFTDTTTLEFSDMRKFGWVRLVETGEVERLASIATLGVDALSLGLTRASFAALLAKRGRGSIGEILLDQSFIAGIGNIYRSEALFLAGIEPWRRALTLSSLEQTRLWRSLRQVLREAVRLGGMSDGDFRDTDGLEGRFERNLFVYGRAGKACKKCDTIIQRIKLGQRSAFFCSYCQAPRREG